MKRLLILLLLLSMLLPLVSCGKTPVETEPELTTRIETTAAATEGEPEPDPLVCSISPASLGNAVSIHTALQKAYFADADADKPEKADKTDRKSESVSSALMIS